MNAFFRLPLEESIPTHTPSGVEVDREKFIDQMKTLMVTLKQTQLVETVFEMKSLPGYDAMFPTDIAASMKGVVIIMPKFGREHRSSEMSETMRYIRGAGGTNEFNSVLQDTRGASADGGDFVATTHGLLMGWGGSRTNKIAKEVLTGGGGESGQATMAVVDNVELLDGAPLLGDLLAFSGSRTLICQDNAFGKDAAAKAMAAQNKIPWQVLPINPECSVLSFASGSLPVFDVLCDADFPETMDLLGDAGLNPFPVEWSEPRKLGITMRRLCLVVRFSFGGGPGGFRDSMSHIASTRNHAKRSTKPRLGGQQQSYGDQGAPLLAQLRSGELPAPVHQPPPRYRPPMHRHKNDLATRKNPTL